MRFLVTGTAGFIGYHVAKYLLQRGDEVVGLDSVNSYYDVRVKYGRLKDTGIPRDKIEYGIIADSERYSGYRFVRLNLEDHDGLRGIFSEYHFDGVINLAAQAGVRYSLENPHAYVESNINGFINILEECRTHDIGHLVYASSSSVYGINEKMPFSTSDNVDHPISLYAASKKSNELMAHSYSHLFGIPVTGLRFFTVYGPWGRPDMSLFIFVKAILEGKPFNVHNEGRMERDFTYVADIVRGVEKVLESPAVKMESIDGNMDTAVSTAPYRIYNIGNSKPVRLMDFISSIEEHVGRKAIMEMIPIQPGEVVKTWADVSDLIDQFNYAPDTAIDDGVKQFVEWYRSYFGV